MLVKVYYYIVVPYYIVILYYAALTLMKTSGVRWIDDSIKSSWKFISVWVHAVQHLYMLFSLINDCLPEKNTTSKQRLAWFCSYMYFSLLFPLSLLVCLLFWSLYFYNRDLIYPKILDAEVPLILNHAMHTTPVPILVTQLFIMPNIRPTLRSAVLGLTAVSAMYIILLLRMYHIEGEWGYLIFNTITWKQVTASLVLSYVISVACLLLGLRLHTFINKKTIKTKEK